MLKKVYPREGKIFNIFQVHELTIIKKQIDIEISSLQSESKKISKLIGQQISKSQNNESEELFELKNKGNKYRLKISELEEKKRTLDKQIQEEISTLPNFPSKNAPNGKDESNNIQIKTWGDPLRRDNPKSHWEIGENLNLLTLLNQQKYQEVVLLP